MANTLADLIKQGLWDQQIMSDQGSPSATISNVQPGQNPALMRQAAQDRAQYSSPDTPPSNVITNATMGYQPGEAQRIQLSSGHTGIYNPKTDSVDVQLESGGWTSVPMARIKANEAMAQRQAQMAALPFMKQQADITKTLAEAQKAASESGMGGGKPTFNADAGGYVYPPSPENPQGKFVPVSGFQKTEKPLTEYQGQSVMFGTRAAGAHNILNSLEGNVNNLGLKTAYATEGIPLVGSIVNAALSPEQQQVEQAQRNFVNAILRRESGASISSSEFANARAQYFPQPGDSPAVIEQKRQNREMAIKGFARGAGPGQKDIMDVFQAGAPSLTPPGQAQPKAIPKTGEVRNGYMFLGGNPADQTRWRKQ